MPSRAVVRYVRKKDSGHTTHKQRERIIQRLLTIYLNGVGVDFYNDWAAGAYLTQGQNSARLALSSTGGWIDLFIAEPRHGFHGLFIELKREGERPYLRDGVTLSKNPQIQKEGAFLERQRLKGYEAEFGVGLEESKRIINEYLDLPIQEELF